MKRGIVKIFILLVFVLIAGSCACTRGYPLDQRLIVIDIFTGDESNVGTFIDEKYRIIGDDVTDNIGGVSLFGRSRNNHGITEQFLTFKDVANGKEVVGYLAYDPDHPVHQHHLLFLTHKTIVISSHVR